MITVSSQILSMSPPIPVFFSLSRKKRGKRQVDQHKINRGENQRKGRINTHMCVGAHTQILKGDFCHVKFDCIYFVNSI